MYDAMHSRIDAFIAKANASFKSRGFPLELFITIQQNFYFGKILQIISQPRFSTRMDPACSRVRQTFQNEALVTRLRSDIQPREGRQKLYIR